MKLARLSWLLLLLPALPLTAADLKVSGSVTVGTNDNRTVAADPKNGKGPPPWAPAHGHRAKFAYKYFPAQQVYQRASDGVWFYFKNGKWSMGATLPLGLKVDVRTGVSLEMDTDKPYTFHADVKSSHGGGETGNPSSKNAGGSSDAGNGKSKGKGKNK